MDLFQYEWYPYRKRKFGHRLYRGKTMYTESRQSCMIQRERLQKKVTLDFRLLASKTSRK